MKDKIFIPLWRDRCKMLADPRITDEQVGKIIRAAIAYDLHDAEPDPTDEPLIDVIISVLISDIDVSREAAIKQSNARRSAAYKRWHPEISQPVDENELDLIADGYFSE